MTKLPALVKRFLADHRTALRESGKSVLIVALAISALVLAYHVGLFSGLTGLGGVLGESVRQEDIAGAAYVSAASPFTVVVTPEAGTHCAVQYDGQSLESVYARFSPSLGEALGSSGTPTPVTEEEWYSALAGQGVYFDYLDEQYIPVLARWLGTDVTGGAALHMARRFCLARSGSGVDLYYYRTRLDAGAYKCATALSWSDLSAWVAEYIPNGAQYNFELEDGFRQVEPCAVISDDMITLRAVSVKNSLQTGVDDALVMSAFGMNSFLASPYTEADGTVIWVEGNFTLRMGADGVSVFTTEGVESGDTPDAAQAIEYGRALCAATVGADCGEAELYLSYVWHDTENGSYKLTFDYAVNGLPVSLPDGQSAAELVLTGGTVTYARMVHRKYSFADGAEHPLPSLLSAAVVQASGGGESVLCYVDDMTKVHADWMIR